MTGTPFPNPLAAARDLVFVSYSHADKIWLERLRIFLKPYTKQNFQVWVDPYIEAGDDWRREITTALSRSCVGVLLVSGNFLASDFIYEEELTPLLSAADAGEITLIPVPVSASGYKETPLARFQFAHSPDVPLDSLQEHERNGALVKIAKQIATAAQKASNVASSMGAGSRDRGADHPARRRAASAVPRDAARGPRTATRARARTIAPPSPRRPDDVATSQQAAAMVPVISVVPTGRAAALHGVPGQRPNYLRRQEFSIA